MEFAHKELPKEEFKKPEHKGKYNLFRMQCYDLLALEDMEYNGFLFDVENAKKKSDIFYPQPMDSVMVLVSIPGTN